MKNLFRLILVVFLFLILSTCSKDGGEELVLKANNEWIKGRNHGAVEIFKSVLKKYPTGQAAQESLFRLGEIYHFSLNDSSQAISYFQEVMELDKDGPFGFSAQKYIAEIMEFTFKDFDQAIIEYQNLIDQFNRPHKNGDHQYRIASIYFKLQNYEQALAEFEVLLQQYPKSTWAEKVQFQILEVLYTLDRCSDVQEQYDQFLNQYPGSKYLNEMTFVLASCLENEGMLGEAFEKFVSLQENYTYPSLLKMKIEAIEKRIKKTR